MRIWLARKLIMQRRMLTEPTTFFSLVGITIGVAFLMVVMAGFSGFAKTLQQSIVDVSGDIVVYKRGGGRIHDIDEFAKELQKIVPDTNHILPYARTEAMVAHRGKIVTVYLSGVDWEKSKNVLVLDNKVIARLPPSERPRGDGAYIGKEVAARLQLRPGDTFNAIVLKAAKTSATGVVPKAQEFYVAAVVDFGKYDFNERFMFADLSVVQKLAGMGQAVSGFRLRLHDSGLAVARAQTLQNQLGWEYGVVDWTQVHKSLFSAVEYEKMVLFFVMCIVVVAAFFNVSTTLFLNVLRRYSQVSILKALGVKRWEIMLIFCLNGLFLGVVGLGLGLGLGLFFCWLFEAVQKIYPIMPAEVYNLTFVMTDLQSKDLVMVIVATLVICLLSTLAPALRGATLPPVEGLKYE